MLKCSARSAGSTVRVSQCAWVCSNICIELHEERLWIRRRCIDDSCPWEATLCACVEAEADTAEPTMVHQQEYEQGDIAALGLLSRSHLAQKGIHHRVGPRLLTGG